MALPESIRVKLSSEDAGSISITPVVVQTMPLRELMDLILAAAGKDAARVRVLLSRGNLVNGASRYRWQPLDAGEEEVGALLALFPDPEPGRDFLPDGCVKVVFHGPSTRLELTREIAMRKRMLHRNSFWEQMVRTASGGVPRYVTYSYREKADEYRLAITPGLLRQFREQSRLLTYSALAAQIANSPLEYLTLFVARAGAAR